MHYQETDTIPARRTYHRKAEASRGHSSPNPLLKTRSVTAGRSWSRPVTFWLSPRLETPQPLWATLPAFHKYILNRKLSRCFKTTPIQITLFPEGKSLVPNKTLQAVSYKGLKPQNSTQFAFPNNGLQEIFLGKSHPTNKPTNKCKSSCTRKTLTYFFLN